MSQTNPITKAEMPEISARSAIVVTQKEGRILLEKNTRLKMYPAFATKILATIIALEKCRLSDMVTVSQNVVAEMAKWKGSASIELKEGEIISVQDLIYSMMLASANDSMFAMGEFISGDKDSFTRLMQEKAKAIGAADTVLTDNMGRFTSEQLSNAYDMAIICRYCMTNKAFRQIAATEKYTIPATNKSAERPLTNSNLLINSQSKRYRYDTAIGIKSGYSQRSKACLACTALPPNDRYGEEILTIIFGAENTKQVKHAFKDAISLFEFTFNNFEALSGKKPDKEQHKEQHGIFSANELCEMLGAAKINTGDVSVSTFSSGKQKIIHGCAYFAVDEASARKASESGAAVIISEKAYDALPCLVVGSLQNAKAAVASELKTKLGLWSVGILDCPDKINPHGMICQMLSDRMKIVSSAYLDNSYERMLKALLSADSRTKAAVINISCTDEGNVEKMSDTANFDVAILSSAVVAQNVKELSKSELIEEKLKICNGMSEAGTVIINIDDKNLAGIFTVPQEIITIGVDNRLADYYADDISIDRSNISFSIVNGSNRYHVELNTDDKHSVYQALETFALGEIMGIPPKQAIASIEKYRGSDNVNKAMSRNGALLLYDFENEAKESLSNSIKELCTCTIPERARRIAVFSEIGMDNEENEKEVYRKVGTLLNKCPVDIAVCYKSTAFAIADTADLKNKTIIKFESEQALTEYLQLNICKNDAILFKGAGNSGLDDIMNQLL